MEEDVISVEIVKGKPSLSYIVTAVPVVHLQSFTYAH